METYPKPQSSSNLTISNPPDLSVEEGKQTVSQAEEAKEVIRYAPFFKRVEASIVDIILFTVIFLPLSFASEGNITAEGIIGSGLGATFLWAPFLQSRKKQSSWGQRSNGMYVCGKNGEKIGVFVAYLRYASRILCIVSIIGILIIFIDKKKRAWHDIIWGTEVRLRPNKPE